MTEVEKPASVPEQIKPTSRYVAELIGTMILVFIGCGSAVAAGGFIGTQFAYLSIAFAFGIAVLAMVYALGGISGCHINPAITISMLIAKKISAKDAAFYIVAQCVGAVIGAGILYGIAVGTARFNIAISGLGQNGWGPTYNGGYDLTSALIAEIVLTFIFVLVVHGSTHQRVPKGFAGLSIGLALVMVHIVGIAITGTSVNPARSLGPAVFVGGLAIEQLWLFWVAPIIGGILAALVWRAFK
ncbi:MAG: aquaporin Z [Candidatus Bathyarchaeota archaeon]|nr:aquaporin Z [Candidatus Bathyarchaeota archaeon]